MKKFALAAVAAIVATVSLAGVAQAHRHNDDDWGRHGHWGRHHHDDWGRHDHWGRHHYDDWGRHGHWGHRHTKVIIYGSW